MEFYSSYLAVDAARRFAHSALPTAPIVDDGRANERFQQRMANRGRLRRTTASALHRMATRLERNVQVSR
ncbi:hypothetical protein [Natronoglycomyces albus]|uniref:Uncharacterized protein n=1 Tax=Natronoglycomyces albus TaxID=2811108 RepID=A0A895XTU2_9ACTN|nr:hypothetical protein [Natronoglycomyces albus]QSB06719.1 hypothetical protein JQS30_07450 [Natronoglycomyces albus]